MCDDRSRARLKHPAKYQAGLHGSLMARRRGKGLADRDHDPFPLLDRSSGITAATVILLTVIC